MSRKNGVGQIIKALVTVVTLVALTGGFRVIKATLDDLLRRTRRACNAVGPAQLTDSLITLHIIDEMLDVGPCTCTLRINTTGSPLDRHKDKKAWTRGRSWPPSGPLTPGDALDAGRVDARPPPQAPSSGGFLPPWRAHAPAGWGHGGTRNRSTSRSVHTRSVNPAAIAGVQGRHCLAEPVPWVGSGCRRGLRKLL
jgi:hypothetical protein